MRRLASITLALLALATTAGAQHARGDRPFTLRIPTGAFLPTGTQAGVLADAQVNAVQLAWTLRPSLALTGTFAWAHSRNLAAATEPKTDLFTADLGLERRLVSLCGDCRTGLTAFAAAGLGARRLDQRGPGAAAVTAFTGFTGAGAEVRHGRIGLRLEARDYLMNGATHPRGRGLHNDVVVMAGLRLIRAR